MALFSYISLQMRFIWSFQNRQFLEMQHGKKVLRDLQNIISTYLSWVSYLTSGFTNHSQIWANERSANEKCLQYLKRKQAFCFVRRIFRFCLGCLGFVCLGFFPAWFWFFEDLRLGVELKVEGKQRDKWWMIISSSHSSFLQQNTLRNWNSLYF